MCGVWRQRVTFIFVEITGSNASVPSNIHPTQPQTITSTIAFNIGRFLPFPRQSSYYYEEIFVVALPRRDNRWQPSVSGLFPSPTAAAAASEEASLDAPRPGDHYLGDRVYVLDRSPSEMRGNNHKYMFLS